MIPSTAHRVPMNTPASMNERILDETRANVQWCISASREEIDQRLRELDREWDIERAIEANASSVVLASLALGTAIDRRWYILTALVGGFLLQHAVQGWCPPVPVLRNLGFRTAREIDEERNALKQLRGDYDSVDRSDADALLDAAKR